MAVLLLPGFGAVAHANYEPVLDITFPTDPTAGFTDDYHAGRGSGRAHRAIDLFAPAGTPVYAAVGGRVSWLPGRHPTAGFAIHIRGGDGRLYAYYHLGPDRGPASRAYAPGLAEGRTVARGELIGFVGDSGNAAGGRPHLHFEIHQDGVRDPYGTNRLNPYRSLVHALRRGDHVDAATRRASRSGARSAVLRLGDRSAAVAEWQRQLNQVRSSPIAVDGIFGPQTERATRAFQQDRRITVDGIVGPQTRGAMDAVLPRAEPDRLLRVGDRGSAVAEWQRQLNRARPSPIAVDGIFGPQTERATRAFQQDRRITVDGIVGPQTRAAMRALLG